MSVYSQNYDFITLNPTGGNDANGEYDHIDFGNGTNISTVNSIICISAGTITIGSANSSNSTTISMVSCERFNVIPGWCNVLSGLFIGVKSQP